MSGSTAVPRAAIARAGRNPKHTTRPLEHTMPDRPYTDADLRAEAARQLAAHRGRQHPNATFAAMLDAHVESTRTQPGDTGLTWDEALECRDLSTTATAIHALIEGAADVSEWAVNLGADGLAPSTEHEITLNAGERPIARIHFAFEPDMPEDMRTNLVEGIGDAINEAGVEREDIDEDGDSDSDVFDLISEIAARLRDATDSGEYHAVGLIYDLANGRTSCADARTELAEITFRHV
ncbi:hypothetical protein ACWERY_16060 [Streptomyces sp. NPDC004082]